MPFAMLEGSKDLIPVHRYNSPILLKVYRSEETYPKKLELLNGISGRSYPLMFESAYKIAAVDKVKPGSGIHHTRLLTDSKVTAAHYFRAFGVQIHGNLPKNLMKTKASFAVDGDKLVKDVLLNNLLKVRETVLQKGEHGCLFGAMEGGQWVGYMLPNGTILNFILSDLPKKFKPFKITVEFHLVNYVSG